MPPRGALVPGYGAPSSPRCPLTPLALPWLIAAASAQEIVVAPFLQSATPDGVWIVWETDSGDESVVEWGTTEALGQSTSGTSHEGKDGSRIHEVHLTGLSPGTRYRYRVVTGGAASPVHALTTPGGPEDPLTIVAVSDMQRSLHDPGKWGEIVDDGILATLAPDGAVDQSVSFVVIPGDLVENGEDYPRWADEFFAPAADLFAGVPVYPVLGNHEQDADHYFDYFHLPDNGSPGFEEHWWWFDQGNVRVIGLDSNFQYWSTTQQDWLSDVLTDACVDADVDFVFAQLHHPWHSELWTPGEAPFTATVVALLEEFTTDCGKPSVHFFGHTHGYSRGASPEHRHLMVNVATAGGAVDRWGEQPQKDYPEYAVSTDDWGFVVVEVEAGDAPAFALTRYSRGNRDGVVDNAVTDTVVIRRDDAPPEAPVPSGAAGDDVLADCFTMRGGPFVDPDGDGHGASHWQIADACDAFDDPLWESFRQDKNVYFGRDRQHGDDLTDETALRVAEDAALCWRVRYRDDGLTWSAWSEPVPFRVGPYARTADLLGADFESGLSGFDPSSAGVEAVTIRACDLAPPPDGVRALSLGACAGQPAGVAERLVDLSGHASTIDVGDAWAWLSGWFLGDATDATTATLAFLDASGGEIGVSEPIGAATGSWSRVEQGVALPSGTRAVEIRLERSGTPTTASFVDGLSLALGPEAALECAVVHTLDEGDDDARGCGCGGGVPSAPALLAVLALAYRRRIPNRTIRNTTKNPPPM